MRIQTEAVIADPVSKDIGIDMISRAQGSLLGQLAGDALGSLVEFQPPRMDSIGISQRCQLVD